MKNIQDLNLFIEDNNFNKNKEIGVKRIVLGDKVLIEAVV